MNLYVMRHGEVDVNVKEQINGRNNSSLNINGIKQAKNKIKEINKLNINLVICSPLQRTKETCEYSVTENIPIMYDSRLEERDSKSMMYESVSKLNKNIWYDETKDIVYKDSEGFKSILNRTKELLEDIKTYEKYNVLLITHGDVCKAIYAYLSNITDAKEISLFKQGNCEIKKYDI